MSSSFQTVYGCYIHQQNVLEFGMHLCLLCVSEICGRVAEEGENIIMTLARSRRRLLCASSPCHHCALVFTSAANSCCISSVCRPARRWVGSVWRCARLSGLPDVCIGRLFKRIQCHADFWNQVCVIEGQQMCGSVVSVGVDRCAWSLHVVPEVWTGVCVCVLLFCAFSHYMSESVNWSVCFVFATFFRGTLFQVNILTLNRALFLFLFCF